MPLNVFTDFHHAGLLNSLIMLFEGRLGGNVYRPIGKEWFEKGYWKIYDHPATVEQYLGIGGATPDGSPKLNEIEWEQTSNPTKWKPAKGIYHCKDIDSGQDNKAITFEAFIDMQIDIVIASIPQHLEPFKRLCELHPNHPKLIYQIGNAWDVPADMVVKNVMASAKLSGVPSGVNFIEYHQEFDLNIFKPAKYEMGNYICSFINCFGLQENFSEDWKLFLEVEKLMPDWTFNSWGGQCRDGVCNGSKELAGTMKGSKFIWHTKAGGDGYGHVLYNSAAVGKPIVTKKSYYAGKMGEELMRDGETCLNIDGLSPLDIMRKIEFFSRPDRYRIICDGVYENFKIWVDFDKEAEKIKSFIDNLV